MAIDFMAIGKGRELANDQNWQDRVRAEQADVNAYNRRGREIAGIQREQVFDLGQAAQEAAAYLAPLLSNRQRAADAGVDDVEWMLRQRDTILNDPNFLSKTPEAQQKILEQLGTSANLIAQARLNSGDATAAQRLLRTFGANSQVNNLDVAINSGDPDAILAAAGFSADENGLVNVGGVMVPKIEAVAGITSSRNRGGVIRPAVEAGRAATAKTAAQLLVDEQKQREMNANISNLLIAGYSKGVDGVFTNPASPNQRFNVTLEGIVPVTTPGAAPAGTAVPAATTVPGVSAAPLPAVTPLPNGQLPPLAAISPEANTLNTTTPQLTAAQQAVESVRAGLRPLYDELAVLAPTVTVDDGSFGVAPARQYPYTDPVKMARVQALESAIAKQEQNGQNMLAQVGDLRLARRDANETLTQRQSAATDIGQELVRGYTTIGNDPARLQDFLRKYPAQASTVVAALNAEVQRVEQRLATASAADKAALVEYARRLGTAIGNFSRKA